MAINIYEIEGGEVAWLCENDWDLASQVDALEKWLRLNIQKLPKLKYVADIGFSVRKQASGGGGVLTVECMEMLISIGIEVWFSEYQRE
jgi:hypothetical protein